jgi:D-sedoheptulose 7-phosphate isomerase
MSMQEKVLSAFQESMEVKKLFSEKYSEMVSEVASLIASAFSAGGKLIIFGNGGSSTDASHIAAEFVGRFMRERPGLPAIALNTDMAVITALSNDYGYEEVFTRQLKALASDGDIVIAISTSGNSPNVLKAVEAAKRKKLRVIAFTGADGGKLAARVQYTFKVPSDVTARIQETHITLGHVLCQLVDEILFEAPRKKQSRKR